MIHPSRAPLENVGGQRVGMTLSSVQRPLDLLLAQPFVRRHGVPTEDREYRHRAKDDAGKVERGGRHGEVERGDHDLSVTKPALSACTPSRRK